MEDSILKSLKEMLLGNSDVEEFDTEIIMLINASFSTLFQLGISKDGKPFKISGVTEKWSDVLTDDNKYENVKQYIYVDVKIIFDPPSSSFVLEAYKEVKKEHAWRIAATTDLKEGGTSNE